MADKPISPLAKYADIIPAAGIVLIILFIVIPMPAMALDYMLVLNITLSLVILLVTIYTLQPLDFSIFPSLLLIATLLRLALNVSATRLILLHGHTSDEAAGQVIKSFGKFVVGGDYFVGLAVFAIIVIIQFVVVTSGAQRVAEVAARFTLDAMPGKQMAIDADLNAGLINDDQAKSRRREVEQEADFYGAMDGASKFVRGDAIAAVIIIIVDILGGFGVGILTHGMNLTEALQRYTVLTIGDGLVTQLPAIIVSTATGIVVTRAASDVNLGTEMTRQLFRSWKALAITAALLGVFGAIPGMPTIPFLVAAIVMGVLAYTLKKSIEKELTPEEKIASDEDQPGAATGPEDVASLLQLDALELELGYSLIPLVDESQGGDLMERVAMIRRQNALELGLVVPPIRIRDNMILAPNQYSIKLRGSELAKGEVMIGHYLAMNPSGEEVVEGIETKEPTFGLAALWITDENKDRAETLGYTVVDLSSVISTHIQEIIRKHAHELLTRQNVQKLVDGVKQNAPAVVDELVPGLLTLGELQKVLQELLKEKLPIRDLEMIMENLADKVRETKDLVRLTESVRSTLARHITKTYSDDKGRLNVLTVDPRLEETILAGVEEKEGSSPFLNLSQDKIHEIFRAVSRGVEKAAGEGVQPVLLCQPAVRPFLRKIIERVLPSVAVLSYSEVAQGAEVNSVGLVAMEKPAPTKA